MNVSELYNLTYWADKNIREREIINKYQELQNILQQHTKPNSGKPSFDEQKDRLLENLRSIPLKQLSKDQIKFLEQMDMLDALGDNVAEAVEDILFRNVIDVATSANKLAEIVKKLDTGLNKLKQIQEGLVDCVSYETYEAEDEILIRVTFSQEAAISNVTEFKNWGNVWYEIGRGVAMAHGAPPEDVRIVGATKGSVIFELAVAIAIAKTTSNIILSALKVAEKVLDIKMKAEELSQMKLKNTGLASSLDEEAENEKTHGVKDITESITKELGLKGNSEGDKLSALEKSVTRLVDFIEKGGEVDFVIPDQDPDKDEKYSDVDMAELRTSFEEIRVLEQKVALLEANLAKQDQNDGENNK